MKEYWNNLQASERRTLLAAVAALSLLLIYLLIVEPYQQSFETRKQSLQTQRATLIWMEEAARQVEQLRKTTPQRSRPSGQSLLSLVDSSAKAAGLGEAIKRVQPEGRSVQLWLEQGEFDKLLGWLDGLVNRHGIAIKNLLIERQEGAGLVNARVVVEEGA